MIISFKNINGGGGGGYVLPTATANRLGGVKIGDGVNVDSAGTISVDENYAIINDINQEFEAGKMYALVNENVETKQAEGSVALYLKNNGAIASFDIDTNEDNYDFEPFFSFGDAAYIDIRVSNNGLIVIYYDKGEETIFDNVPLNIDEVNTFELPYHHFVGRLSEPVDFSGCSLDVCVRQESGEKPFAGWIYLRPNGTTINPNETMYPSIQSYVSGHTPLEKMYMELSDWHYNTNIAEQYCETVGTEPTLFDTYLYDGKNLSPVITEQSLPTKDYSVVRPNEGFDAKAGQAYAVLTNGNAVKNSIIGNSKLLANEGCVVTYGDFSENFHIFQGYNCDNSEYVQFDIDKGDNFTFKTTYRHNGVNTLVVDKYLNYGEKNTIELPEQEFNGYFGLVGFENCSVDVYPDIDGNGKVFVVFRPNGAETELNNDNIEYTAFDVENGILAQFRIIKTAIWDNYSSGISLTNAESVHYEGDVLEKVYLSDFNGSYTALADYKGGIPKTFAVDEESYAFDLNLSEGDVLTNAKNHIYLRCKIEDNNMDTLSVGEHSIGNEEKLYVYSEMSDDKLVLQYGDYYGYKLYIYGGQDQHFRFDVYLGDNLVDNGDIYQGATETTQFQNESVTFNLNFEGESLEITISTPQGVPFTVFYNQEHNEPFLNDGTFMIKESGERAALDYWFNTYGNWSRYMVFLYYGELPQDEILFKVHHNQWNSDTYWSWNGEKLCAWNDENMSDRNEGWDMLFNTNGFVDSFYIYNFKEGVLSISSRELDDSWELYGDWYKYDEMTYEPIDWQNKVNNIKSFALPLAYVKINGAAFLGAGDLEIGSVPYGGKNGQILMKTTNDYGNNTFDWRNLAKEVQLVDSLPVFADEGSFVIVNSGVSYTPSTAWLAINTTSPDGRNNFNDNTDISHIGNGQYIYFDCNGELTTSTAKTFLFRIAMRTNENGDWNTSNIAYINVFREYDSVSQEHFYSWDMPPFDYKDDQGNDFTYSDSGTVDSSTTANTTTYLPLWKYWDGTYGYKFTFEYDNVADTLKVWQNHSDIDQIQGENYGYCDYRCQNHTEEFCEFETDPNMSEVYVFKGGVWYKLGELTSSNV